VLEVALALVAALLFALGTVLQQKEAQEVSDEDAHKAGFLLRLARRPVWLAGMGTDGAGYAAQAVALDLGRIVVVQPLIAATVVFALPLGSRILGQRVTRRQMGAALVFTVGLGVFLVLANPEGGREDATTRAWIIALAVAAAVCVPLYLAGRAARSPAMKATLLGIATGVLWGYSAALTKAVMDDLHDGPIAVITDWHLYALLVVGWASLTLAQLSLQAGALAPAVATQAALDPIASALLGLLAFDETLDAGTAALAGAGVGFVAMVVAIVVLAGSAPGEGSDPVRGQTLTAGDG
jgi:drug/metabolite transporter (DMT)-like permease